MALFKCKMCGGELEVHSDASIATCEYCGTKQTVPNGIDEGLQNLYNRANTLRIKCEFDKAERLYEKVIQSNPTQSEAYWGLILCRYGIEYVDDPATFKKIPTCHRASYDSIIADDDYKSALEHADLSQRVLYEEQAREIDRIQKDILALAQKEETYDVFICYKETDSDGKRTQDSVVANDIYYQLTQEGYKVFYAAITLEGKLGSAYEPIIFAALHSAKVMLSIGTRPEYFNAVWVKNEWSRFLKIIKKDRSKLLIPCYRDMDAYELPEEFAHLQAQDMAKIGFINDVVRGIKKVITKDEPKATTVVKETVVENTNVNIAPLLKRAFMFLEDGDFDRADEFCEQILNQDPENAQAYLGKLMAELRVKKQEGLKDQAEPFDHSNNYQKAIRFADEKLKAVLEGYIEHINTRNENARLDGIYTRAKNVMSAAKTEDVFKEAAHLFETISEYQDSAVLAKECYEKAEVARKDAILAESRSQMSNNVISGCKTAIRLLATIPGWKDADELIDVCRRKIDEIKAAQEAARLEKERQAEIARKEAEQKAKRNKNIALITTLIICAVIAFIVVLNNVIIPNGKYNDAIVLMNAGKYSEAISAFKALDGYKDSDNKITECKYNDAIAFMDAGKYTEAISAFKALDGYKDSVNKITECNTAILDGKYNDAIALMDAGNIVEAYEALVALEGYKDSADKANSIYDKYKVEKLKVAKVGDYVFFGAYEQDNNTSNGKEYIEWLVLEVKDGKALVISKYALDCKQYNTRNTYVTWETCTLRKWLNNDFINLAFTVDEKDMIPTVTVSADANPEYSTDPGKATQDQVFLLSITEANKYFRSDSARQCEPTAYAVANGAYVNSSNGTCWWWLRSPGERRTLAALVNLGGGVREDGNSVISDDRAVRPALWIDLNA